MIHNVNRSTMVLSNVKDILILACYLSLCMCVYVCEKQTNKHIWCKYDRNKCVLWKCNRWIIYNTMVSSQDLLLW